MITREEMFSKEELIIAKKLYELLIKENFGEVNIEVAFREGKAVRVESESIVLQFYFYEKSRECEAQIHITSMLLKNGMSRKGIGKKIISTIFDTCNELGMALLIVGIINDGWIDSLIRNGAREVNLEGSERDVYIDPNSWKI